VEEIYEINLRIDGIDKNLDLIIGEGMWERDENGMVYVKEGGIVEGGHFGGIIKRDK